MTQGDPSTTYFRPRKLYTWHVIGDRPHVVLCCCPSTVQRWLNDGSLQEELAGRSVVVEAIKGHGGGIRLSKVQSFYQEQ
jgi:hypothetical protein